MKPGSPIHLFVDAHVFDQEFQGTRTFLREIYALLCQYEHIVLFLAAYDIENLKRNFPNRDNIHFIKYQSRSAIWRLTFEIPRLTREYGIHYAHFQYITPLFKNCRYIVTIHDVLFNEYKEEFPLSYRLIKNFFFRRSALQSEIVTTVSDYSREAIEKYLGIKKEKTGVIHNGVGAQFFAPYDKTRAASHIREKYGFDKYLLYVSRVEPRKNHLNLLNAWLDLELYKKGYHLVFLGHKSLGVPQLDQRIEGLAPEIRKYIFIHSGIDEAGLLEFYRAAAAFVYISKAEGFGIPPLEAAAMEIPVICSNTSAMSSYSFFGENHIDPLNYELLKSRLGFILEQPSFKETLKAISAQIQREYSWEASAGRLYEIIENDKKDYL
jgi:glycosyltransferase involved in cell wall biosynthesis